MFSLFCETMQQNDVDVDVDDTTDVEWMYELRQSPICPPQPYETSSARLPFCGRDRGSAPNSAGGVN